MILLDNGHGKDTPGKRSPVWSDGTQLFEWEFTRDIVKRIHESLDNINIPSIILVPEAIDVSLRTRVNRANEFYVKYPGSILLSIHGNAGMKLNQGSGWEVWTAPGETKSDLFATFLFSAAKENLPGFLLRADFTDKDPDKESRFYILVKTNCPAVLTENLFYDNVKDCKFMLSDHGRRSIAKLHVDAIIKYLK